jgi:hypothetical protein
MKRIYFQQHETDEKNMIAMEFIKEFPDSTACEADSVTWRLLYEAEIYDIMVKNNDGPFVSYHNIGNIAINDTNINQLFYIFKIKEEFKQISSIYTKVMQLVYNMTLPTHAESVMSVIPFDWNKWYNTGFKNNNYSITPDETGGIITATLIIDPTIGEI